MEKATWGKYLVKKSGEFMELTFIRQYRDPSFLYNNKTKVSRNWLLHKQIIVQKLLTLDAISL